MEDAAGNDRDQLIVRVLADTGIRNGELCGLRMQDLLERNRDHYLEVSGKGSKERLVPISPTLYRRIRRYAERKRPEDAATDRLFISRRRDGRSGNSEPLTTSGIQQLVRQLAEKAGVKKRVHPHTFRHSTITYMLQKGMNAILVADIVGHADLDMIRRVYALMLVLRADEQPR